MPKAGRHFNTVTKLLLVIVCHLFLYLSRISNETAVFQFVASYNSQHWMRDLPPFNEVHQIVQARDHTFWVQSSSSSSSGPPPSVQGESQLSSGVSFDYSYLMTNDRSIN